MKLTLTASKLLISLTLITASLSNGAAIADTPRGDVFNRNTDAQPQSKVESANPIGFLNPNMGRKTEAAKWFETLDNAVRDHEVTEHEKTILVGELGSPPKAERVAEWTNTAAAIAKRYHELSRILAATQLSPALRTRKEAPSMLSYAKDLSQWYEDTAIWYEDYIKPRTPARSIEELDDQLRVMHNRSLQLKNVMTSLQGEDSSLRSDLNVHAADNKIAKYAAQAPVSQQH
jgi:hypothetical protein